MKNILFTGDSHTCGEYASGFVASDITLGYDPKGLGVGRHVPLNASGYTNLVHKFICDKTGSDVQELDADKLSTSFNLEVLDNNVKLNGPITFKEDCDCIQIMFGVTQNRAVITVVSDGEARDYTLYTQSPRFGRWSFKWFNFNSDNVTVIPHGDVYISFVRYCKGSWSCINSGVGSCTCKYFKENFIPFNLEPFKADIIIAEAHTINDWLSGCTPKQYEDDLMGLLNELKRYTNRLYLMTVSPILGPQGLPFNQSDYSLFVEASIRAAARAGVCVIDAGKAVKDMLSGLDPDEVKSYYHDNWHLKDEGHRAYADAVIKELDKII